MQRCAEGFNSGVKWLICAFMAGYWEAFSKVIIPNEKKECELELVTSYLGTAF
jgi:hypothetical protein